jgi:hypothetical protein
MYRSGFDSAVGKTQLANHPAVKHELFVHVLMRKKVKSINTIDAMLARQY